MSSPSTRTAWVGRACASARYHYITLLITFLMQCVDLDTALLSRIFDTNTPVCTHDDVIKWKPLPRHWPFVVTGEFPTRRPVTRSFDVFFDLCVNERLSKESWGWWIETPSRPLWRHSNAILRYFIGSVIRLTSIWDGEHRLRFSAWHVNLLTLKNHKQNTRGLSY